MLEAGDFEQFTPLLLSACYKNAKITKLLLKSEADITATEYREKNVFHLASEFDRTDVLKVRHLQTSTPEFGRIGVSVK